MNSYCNNFGWIPDVIIYLKADTDVCYNRCLKRNRDGEESIPKQYLANINTLYNNYYLEKDKVLDYNVLNLGVEWSSINNKEVKIYTIDANKDVDSVLIDTIKIIRQIIDNH